MHYFDNAATTRVYPEASLRAAHAMNTLYGNPSSLHKAGREAAAELARARHAVAAAIGAADGEVVFTSGGTEGDNQAIQSAVFAARRVGRHLITTAVEHPAVLEPIRAFQAKGFDVTFLKPEKDGAVTVEALEAALRDDTALVSVMLVNNETGAVNPVAAMREAMTRRGSRAVLHCDAVQGLFKVPINVHALGVDMLTVSAHKIHAPKGAGALYIRQGFRAVPILLGGGQERTLRSGTENLPSIAGFGVAAHLGRERFAETARRMLELRRYFDARLAADVPEARVNFAGGVPHIASVCLPGCRSEVILRILSDRDVYVSAGSACAKGKRSHVLTACGLPSDVIDCTIRVSFSEMNEEADIDALVSGLAAAYARFHRT